MTPKTCPKCKGLGGYPRCPECLNSRTAKDHAPGVASHALFGSWIAERYPTSESAKLQCAEATAAMIDAFPMLRRVRGHVMIGIDFRPHWWCVTPEGEIIDPTVHQWSAPPVFYDAMPEDSEEPCGKCIYCGDLLYRSRGADSYLCENCLPNAIGEARASQDSNNQTP
jgi:hypothetical protein